MIRTERQRDVAVVTIDRPERRNAVDADALEGIAAAVSGAAGARALVLVGEGGHFCAGADLQGVEDATFGSALRAALDALGTAPFPTIAAVEGAALGAGTQLAVACDLRIASRGARFGIPAARLGLMVDRWTVARLAALAGESIARGMLLAAETISGEDAHAVGFVHRIGGVDDALRWAAEIAELAPLTVQGHKLFLASLAAGADDHEADAAFRRAWASEDLREGLAAFRERRRPRFEGR